MNDKKKKKVQEDLETLQQEFEAAMKLKNAEIRKLELENNKLEKKADVANSAL